MPVARWAVALSCLFAAFASGARSHRGRGRRLRRRGRGPRRVARRDRRRRRAHRRGQPAGAPCRREDDLPRGTHAAAGAHGRAHPPQLHHRRRMGDRAGALHGRRLCAARAAACFEDAARRLHDGARPRHGSRLLRRRADARDRQGLGDRPARDPGRSRPVGHRRALRPDHGPRARRRAAGLRLRHGRRRRRSAEGRALPDQARRQGHQDLRDRGRAVVRGPGRAPSSTRSRSCARRRRRRTGTASGSRPTRTAPRASSPPARRASTASSTTR